MIYLVFIGLILNTTVLIQSSPINQVYCQKSIGGRCATQSAIKGDTNADSVSPVGSNRSQLSLPQAQKDAVSDSSGSKGDDICHLPEQGDQPAFLEITEAEQIVQLMQKLVGTKFNFVRYRWRENLPFKRLTTDTGINFKIIQVIGTGGFGQVFKIRWSESESTTDSSTSKKSEESLMTDDRSENFQTTRKSRTEVSQTLSRGKASSNCSLQSSETDDDSIAIKNNDPNFKQEFFSIGTNKISKSLKKVEDSSSMEESSPSGVKDGAQSPEAKCLIALKYITKYNELKNIVENEIKILRQLNHPSIPMLISTFNDVQHDAFGIMMQLCPGLDLISIQSGPTLENLSEFKNLASQLLFCLKYLHSECQIMHCDIKPDNIIYDDHRRRAYLVDFGFARSLPNKGEKLVSWMGTINYAAPEVIELLYHQRNSRFLLEIRLSSHIGYTQSADIWSLGASLLTHYQQQIIREKSNIQEIFLWEHFNMQPPYIHTEKAQFFCTGTMANFFNSLMAPKSDIRPTAAQLIQTHPFLTNSEST